MRRQAPWLVGSLVLHLALMVALVLWPDRWPSEPQELPPPAFDIVFEGGQPEAEPPPGEETRPSGLASPVTPGDVAAPSAPPDLPSPPTSAPPPPQPPPAGQPGRLAEAPPPPPPPPGLPAPAMPPEPIAGPTPPPPPPPPPPVPRDLAGSPPPPAPAPRPRETAEAPPSPPPAAPAAPRPPQQAAPAFPPGGLFLPGGLQLGRPAAPSGRPQARGLDLQVDPRMAEAWTNADPTVRVSGAQVGADWRAAFRRWLDQNMRYPRRAAELGESGTVRVRVVAGPDGKVRSVRLTGASVSPSLNFGTTFPFADAQLPAFPPPADPAGVTIDLTVNYSIIRR